MRSGRAQRAGPGNETLKDGRWHPLERTLRVGVFYDGVTFKIASDYYRYQSPWQARISFEGVDRIVEREVQGWLHRRCEVVERHLFIGLACRPGGGRVGLAESFERAMQRAGVQPHYLRRNRRGEKGVDTALALEMQTAVLEGRIQIAALVATDGDFVPAAQAVRRAGGRLVLVGLHLPRLSPRPMILSPELTDAADRVISLTEWIGAGADPMALRQTSLFWVPRQSVMRKAWI